MKSLFVIIRSFYFRTLGNIQRKLDVLLIWAYCTPHPQTRAAAIRLFFELKRVFLLLRYGLSFKINWIRGKASIDGSDLQVVYLADGKGLNYLQHLLFGDNPVTREVHGRCPAWRVPRLAAALAGKADLVIVERNTLLKWLPGYGRWVTGPTWVRMVHDFAPGQTWEQVGQDFRKHEMNIKRFRRAGYATFLSQKDEDFDFFYDRMHLPLIHERHKEYGIVDTRESMRSQFKRGFIMFAGLPENPKVAADMNMVCGDVFMGISNGLLDGDQAWLQTGALSALYFGSIKWCFDHHIRRCDIGEVRPFANDGLYQYKRRWGFRPIRELWNPREWLIWAPHSSETALRWLEAHPFIPEFARSGGEFASRPIASPSDPVGPPVIQTPAHGS